MNDNAKPEVAASDLAAPKQAGKKPRRKRLRGRFWRGIGKIIRTLILAIVLLTAGLFAFKAYITHTASDLRNSPAYRRAVVQSGAMSDTVYGTGTTSAKNQPSFMAEADGTLTELRVSVGDTVKQGDVLAVIANDDIDAAITDYELALWQLDADIQETAAGSGVLSVRAPMAGRVMALYGEVGEDTLAVFRREGALAILSADGRMKVVLSDVPVSAQLGLGDTVQVVGDGVDVTGSVSDLTLQGTQATITIIGDELPMNVPVSVLNMDGFVLGESILEINKPMAVSAYGGTIKAIRAKVGQKVDRKDQLFTLENSPLTLTLESLRLQRETAAKDLANARAQRENLIVLAPCDGTVASLDVAAGTAVTSGTVLGSILQGEDMTLKIAVDELDVVDVKIGQAVAITIDALSGVELTGEVYKIAPVGTNSGGVTTYDVELAFDAAGTGVRSGMNATGEIEIASSSNAVYVPVEALMTMGDATYVMVEGSGTQAAASANPNTGREQSARSGAQRSERSGMTQRSGEMSGMPEGMNRGDLSAAPEGVSRGGAPALPENQGSQGSSEGTPSLWTRAATVFKTAYDGMMDWLYEDVSLTEDTVSGSLVEVTVGMQNDDYAQILSGVSVGQTLIYTSDTSSDTSSRYSGFGGMGGGMPMGGRMGF